MVKIEVISVLQRAATFELCCNGESAYYAPGPFSLLLNGEPAKQCDTNVFTLFDLQPGMSYKVSAVLKNGSQASCEFITPEETVCLDVTLFGAVGDGKTDCTGPLQAAISCCPPGGTVYVPKGVYLSYPLFLKSHQLLYLAKGAVILGGPCRERYPILPGMLPAGNGNQELAFGSWEGNPLDTFASLLTAVGTTHTAIAGEGVIDANAQQAGWWENPKKKIGAWRPRTVFCVRCNHLTLMGITVQNSPSWTVHPYYCTNVDILGIKLCNPPDSPNTDGCDPECCENVRILGADISVGDDCISIKSGKYYMAAYHPGPAKNFLIRNCLLRRGHGAVVAGSEISAGVYDVRIEQCIFQNTDRGLRIKTRRGRGSSSIVDGIEMRHVVMQGVLTPFVANMFYFCDPDGHTLQVRSKEAWPVGELTPRIGSLKCSHITCTGAEYAGCFFYGLPESPIGEISLSHVTVEFSEDAGSGFPAMMDDVEEVSRLAFFATNVERISLEDVLFRGAEGETYQVAKVGEFLIDGKPVVQGGIN